jgi:DNA-binding transcriptional ArsR family regulator
MAVRSTPVSTGESGQEADPASVLEALGDHISREILLQGMDHAVTAEELAARCGVSESTIYRRLERLSDLGLVERRNHLLEQTNGNGAYRTVVDGLSARLDESGFSVERGSADPLRDALETIARNVDVETLTYDADSHRVHVQLRVDDEATFRQFVALYARSPRR